MARMGRIAAPLAIMFSCIPIATTPSALDAPPRTIFPNRELSYRALGTVDEVRSRVLEYLGTKHLAYIQELSAPYTYIITVFSREPSDSGIRRSRRAAYLLRLSLDQVTPSRCTGASLNWLVQSRGYAEEDWTIQDTDVEYIPPMRDSLIAIFQLRKCK
jgi:hypothetical protein